MKPLKLMNPRGNLDSLRSSQKGSKSFIVHSWYEFNDFVVWPFPEYKNGSSFTIAHAASRESALVKIIPPFQGLRGPEGSIQSSRSVFLKNQCEE